MGASKAPPANVTISSVAVSGTNLLITLPKAMLYKSGIPAITCQGVLPTAITSVTPTSFILDYPNAVIPNSVVVIPKNDPTFRTPDGGFINYGRMTVGQQYAIAEVNVGDPASLILWTLTGANWPDPYTPPSPAFQISADGVVWSSPIATDSVAGAVATLEYAVEAADGWIWRVNPATPIYVAGKQITIPATGDIGGFV